MFRSDSYYNLGCHERQCRHGKRKRVEVSLTCKQTTIVQSGGAIVCLELVRSDVTYIVDSMLDVATESIGIIEAP